MAESAGATVAAATTVFHAQGITKVYHMGEVDVHALRGVDLELFRAGEAWAVYRVVEGRAVRQVIDIGRRNGLEAEVLSGLSAGDRVVVHPSDAVVDGVAVVERPT